jgi:hypothetical protein
MGGQEKRQRVRLSLNMPVDLRRINLVDLEHATLGDITPEGVFIATAQKISPGTEIELALSFPRHRGQTRRHDQRDVRNGGGAL